jgi:muconolactone D-isomerase
VEFLVEIDVQWPPEGDPEQRAKLIAAETSRARELAQAGILKRVWRIPGRWANVCLWEAPDATALHEAIASLPFYPWLKVVVRPLAAHPNDPLRKAAKEEAGIASRAG